MTQQIIASTLSQSFSIQPVMMHGIMRSMMMSLTIPEAIPQ